MTAGKSIEHMTEEEEAEYFYAHREEFERNAKTPVSLERVCPQDSVTRSSS